MVEKIKRDLRITTIYEGTSEIMEMTIARDRWQQHLKTNGDYYRDAAAHALDPAASLALQALAALLEACRVNRLTRNQHVLLRLGELIAYAETAACLARRASAAAKRELPEKADQRFDADTLAVISRIFAREAALKVAEEGLRWVGGALPAGDAAGEMLAEAMGLKAIRAAQAGLIADMDHLADALYGRSDDSAAS